MLNRASVGFIGSVCLAVVFIACAQGGEVTGGAQFDGGVANPDGSASDADDAFDSTLADTSIEDATATDSPVDGDGATDGATDGETNPCIGVTCDTPPANACADSSNLRVYSASGTCSAGVCSYAASTIPCPLGCEAGACKGDPCAGKTCNMPPSNSCASAEYLTVYDPLGTCSAGTCSYPSRTIHCSFGCAAGVCNGDPCLGKTCASPPSNYCSDASNLVVYEVPGTCAAGSCSYKNHTEFCAFGCASGACKGDPCAGVTCGTPPSNYCVSATQLRRFTTPGACSAGACTYPSTDVACTCSGGKCVECAVDADCTAGKWCNAGTCAPCNTDLRCGSTCASCVSSSKVCNSSGTACVECNVDSHCGAGKFCDAGTCTSCVTAAKCGPSCVTCSGTTPACGGSSCVCNSTSCGSGYTCAGGACALCATDSSCGPSCSACGGSTPKCFAGSTSSQCVECLSNADCASDKACDLATHTCKAKCPTTPTTVFSDDFTTPSSTAWSSGTDAALGTSNWKVYTTANHGLRISGGMLQITNKRSGSPDHGQGYAYVRTGGSGAHYNPLYNPVLKSNVDTNVVWTLNMRRDDPEGTNGGFKCSSTSSQNNITIGVAYVLASDAAAGLNSSASTCSASTTGHGYAVVLGGSNRLRLVRFSGGLRNGTLTDLVTATGYTIDNYFSVRVTYNAKIDQWKLEVRNDGASAFSSPTGGSAYGFTGTATDATYVSEALNFAGPYFQTGCTGLCSSTMYAWFDNVSVGMVCAP